MHIEHLSLTNFRNYARLELSLPADAPVVLHGANAQGKTSLLEAIYYLATAKSPYTASDRQLIHWRVEDDPLPFARVSGEVSSRQHALTRLEITLMIERTPEGSARFRKVVAHQRRGKARHGHRRAGQRGAVSAAGFDADRRVACRTAAASSTTRSVRSRALIWKRWTSTRSVLPQRNALLRRIAERRGSPRELDFWDEKLVKSGSVIIAGRQRFLRELQALAQRGAVRTDRQPRDCSRCAISRAFCRRSRVMVSSRSRWWGWICTAN